MDEKEVKDGKSTIFNSIRKYISSISSKAKIKILLGVGLIAVCFVMYSGYMESSTTASTEASTNNNRFTYYVSSIDYCNELEAKLKKVLSGIDGVGEVEVMITLASSMELVFATGENSDSVGIFGSNDKDTTKSPIIIDNNGKEEPLVVKEVLPKVKGVLVVCSNQVSVANKLNIIHAVQSLLNIDLTNIQVLSK